MKDKKGVTITNAFQKKLNVSGHKPIRTWADQGCEFCNRSMKSKLHDNYMYSAQREGKFIVAERFIRILKNKTYKHMTAVSKNV